MKKQETKDKTLTEKQISVVKEKIVDSMRNVYTDAGSLPGDGFEHVSGLIADKIIKNIQAGLKEREDFPKKVVVKGTGPKFIASQAKGGPIKVTRYGKKKKNVRK